MIIDVVNQKYQTGSKRGMTVIEHPLLLAKLNSIIEWDYCKFPKTKEVEGADEKEEDREYLGAEPELKPGNVFLFRGQLIGIDSDSSIVLIISETGYGALNRIWEEYIVPEMDMKYNSDIDTEIEWTASRLSEIPENFQYVSGPFSMFKIWKTRFVQGRGLLEGDELCVKIKIDTEGLVFQETMYITNWGVWFNPKYLEEDQVKDFIPNMLSWFYENYSRMAMSEEEKNDRSK